MNENNYIVKANKFIEAKGRLGVLEQKFMGALISEITPDDKDFKDYELEIREVAEFISLNSKAIYDQIKTVTRNLRKKEIFIEETDEKGKKSFLVTSLISSAKYKEGQGVVVVRIDPNLKPYLLAINGKETYFTKYMIKNILKLNSSHSIRMYELLKQCEGMRKREFEVEELKKFLGIDASSYDFFAEFERRVLKPSKAEINEKTDIWIDYKKIKKGRKIARLVFDIEPKFDDDKMKAIMGEGEIEDIKEKCGLVVEKFNHKQIVELYEIAVKKTESAEIDPCEYIRLNYLNMLERGTARNKFAWLKKALEEDYASAVVQISLNHYINKSS